MIQSVTKKKGGVTEIRILMNVTVSPRKDKTQFYPWNFHEWGFPFGKKKGSLQGVLIINIKKKPKSHGKKSKNSPKR